MTVTEFLERHDSEQITELQAFDCLTPIGDERLDRLAALIAWVCGGKVGTIADYLPQWGKEKAKPLTEEEARKALANFK